MKLPSRVPEHATKVFEGIIYDIYQWEQKLFDGSSATFEMAKHIDAVSIIPIIDDKVVILHEQQPRDVKRISFPGGQIDPGETIYEAALRELREETGMQFKTLKLVAIDDLGSTKADWWIYRFIATDLESTGEPKQDPGEQITHEIVSFEKAKILADSNVYMSLSVMGQVNSVEDLLSLPEIEL